MGIFVPEYIGVFPQEDDSEEELEEEDEEVMVLVAARPAWIDMENGSLRRREEDGVVIDVKAWMK